MRHYVLVIAGLSVEEHDAVRAISELRFVERGKLIVKPVTRKRPMDDAYARSLAVEASEYLSTLPEHQDVSVVTLTVRRTSGEIGAVRCRLFPFSLFRNIGAIPESLASNRAERNGELNRYVEYLVAEAKIALERSRQVSDRLQAAARTPLLLPLRNFRSRHLWNLLNRLSSEFGDSANPSELLAEATEEFTRHHGLAPWKGARGACFCDGHLAFDGPGRARHGFYRAGSGEHNSFCLLNARSRIGGAYDYRFHYDAQPQHRLSPSYPNCHDAECQPKPTHVNISPNDFIR